MHKLVRFQATTTKKFAFFGKSLELFSFPIIEVTRVAKERERVLGAVDKDKRIYIYTFELVCMYRLVNLLST